MAYVPFCNFLYTADDLPTSRLLQASPTASLSADNHATLLLSLSVAIMHMLGRSPASSSMMVMGYSALGTKDQPKESIGKLTGHFIKPLFMENKLEYFFVYTHGQLNYKSINLFHCPRFTFHLCRI